MRSKKNVLVSLTAFIAIVLVLSLFGQQGKPFEEIWEKLNKLEQRIVDLEGSSGDGLPDYSEAIAGTWIGTSYERPPWDLNTDFLIDRGAISVTFSMPDGEGRGTYESFPLNPFYPERTDWYHEVTLTGMYQIKGDYLMVVVHREEDIYPRDKFMLPIKIRGNEMIFDNTYVGWTLGFYQKQE